MQVTAVNDMVRAKKLSAALQSVCSCKANIECDVSCERKERGTKRRSMQGEREVERKVYLFCLSDLLVKEIKMEK